MHFRTGSGVPGTASWNFAGIADEDRIEITGTQGRIALSVFGNEPVQFESGAGVESFDLPSPRYIQQPLIQSVVDDLLDRGECPSTGASAARTSAVMDTVTRSFYGSRDNGFWERPESWPGRE